MTHNYDDHNGKFYLFAVYDAMFGMLLGFTLFGAKFFVIVEFLYPFSPIVEIVSFILFLYLVIIPYLRALHERNKLDLALFKHKYWKKFDLMYTIYTSYVSISLFIILLPFSNPSLFYLFFSPFFPFYFIFFSFADAAISFQSGNLPLTLFHLSFPYATLALITYIILKGEVNVDIIIHDIVIYPDVKCHAIHSFLIWGPLLTILSVLNGGSVYSLLFYLPYFVIYFVVQLRYKRELEKASLLAVDPTEIRFGLKENPPPGVTFIVKIGYRELKLDTNFSAKIYSPSPVDYEILVVLYDRDAYEVDYRPRFGIARPGDTVVITFSVKKKLVTKEIDYQGVKALYVEFPKDRDVEINVPHVLKTLYLDIKGEYSYIITERLPNIGKISDTKAKLLIYSKLALVLKDLHSSGYSAPFMFNYDIYTDREINTIQDALQAEVKLHPLAIANEGEKIDNIIADENYDRKILCDKIREILPTFSSCSSFDEIAKELENEAMK